MWKKVRFIRQKNTWELCVALGGITYMPYRRIDLEDALALRSWGFWYPMGIWQGGDDNVYKEVNGLVYCLSLLI